MNRLIPVEFKNQRIMTTKTLAEQFGTKEENIKANFNRNLERFIEGKHYYQLQGEELQEFKRLVTNSNDPSIKYASVLNLWTDCGAARHAKILQTDEAWEVYEALEENYFNPKQKQLSPLEQLKLHYQVIEEHEEKLNTIETKVNVLENHMVIEYGQEVTIKKEVDKQVCKVCFGNLSPAYEDKKLRSKVYKALWRDYKDYFAITSYHNTLKKDLDKALELVAGWKPTGGLLREIQLSISQISMQGGSL